MTTKPFISLTILLFAASVACSKPTQKLVPRGEPVKTDEPVEAEDPAPSEGETNDETDDTQPDTSLPATNMSALQGKWKLKEVTCEDGGVATGELQAENLNYRNGHWKQMLTIGEGSKGTIDYVTLLNQYDRIWTCAASSAVELTDLGGGKIKFASRAASFQTVERGAGAPCDAEIPVLEFEGSFEVRETMLRIKHPKNSSRKCANGVPVWKYLKVSP